MAVKASAQITLNSVVDIEATYRYYLLQSSTLSKPSKPTTNPPDDAWDDSEPTYTSGSTNSLYYVDLTVFSDGNFQYSEVSLSTAYEAAKEAYNKAQNAQDTADEASSKIDDTNANIVDMEASLSESIAQTKNDITTEISDNYYTKDETDTLVGDVASDLDATKTDNALNFASMTEHINSVDDDLQNKWDLMSADIEFTSDGIIIGRTRPSGNYLRLKITAEGILFTKNDEPVGYWDGDDFFTGNIVVEVNERAQFGNFAFVTRSDGSLIFLKVGG